MVNSISDNQNKRLYASHYILLPDGALAKWPLVAISTTGVILEIQLRDSFKEVPGLELHPGILLPGFVDVCETNRSESSTPPNFNRHFAHGTLLLGSAVPNPNPSLPKVVAPKLSNKNDPSFLLRNSNNDLTIFSRLKEYQKLNSTTDLTQLLYWSTQCGAQKTEYKTQLGKLKVGFQPGLMVLQKIDLNTMQLTEQSQIKWLSTPKLD